MKKRGRHGAQFAAASKLHREDDLLRAREFASRGRPWGGPLTFPRKPARTGGETIPSVGQSEIGAVGPCQKQKRKRNTSSGRRKRRGRGRRGNEKTKRKRRPWKTDRGKESEQRDGTEEKMRSRGNSPQSQPGHVDLPIPRWV